MRKNVETKTAVVILLAVVLVFGIFFFYYLTGSPSSTSSSPTSPSSTPTAIYATQGTLVQGFPSGLILNDDQTFPASYSIEGEEVAEWSSSFSIDDLYNSYQDYLNATGWTITSETVTPSTVRGLSATMGTASVNVTITKQGNESDVTVSYTPQN